MKFCESSLSNSFFKLVKFGKNLIFGRNRKIRLNCNFLKSHLLFFIYFMLWCVGPCRYLEMGLSGGHLSQCWREVGGCEGKLSLDLDLDRHLPTPQHHNQITTSQPPSHCHLLTTPQPTPHHHNRITTTQQSSHHNHHHIPSTTNATTTSHHHNKTSMILPPTLITCNHHTYTAIFRRSLAVLACPQSKSNICGFSLKSALSSIHLII